ncbi:Uncharacterised protein [BD1-7 clade bacterium]|uniref:Uncharacterized protein n=1 Tax=BD1-7 clade bacterium TaxID=2029982 RepID=A0A5S9N5F6_9GAMM|nr:Uncharacterised protein [BD1-7 clade bacterium]CAA0085056.1 Uncharacterised protein [BD1-7 clade bacterium]
MKSSIIQSAIGKLLKPLVVLLLRSSVSYQQASEWLKIAFIEAAEEIGPQDKPATTSWIATVTGLNRKEVKRIRDQGAGDADDAIDRSPPVNRAQRVINQWMTDPDYLQSDGEPSALAFDGDGVNFSTLVKKSSGDMTPRAVANELERQGVIEITSTQTLQLIQQGYFPPPGSDKQWVLAGQSAADLITTLSHNLQVDTEDARFQRMVSYRYLPVSQHAAFEQLSNKKLTESLKELNVWLSQHAGKSPNDIDEATARVSVGMYLYKSDSKE